MIALVVAGVTYEYPQTGDTVWGDGATNWASAVTNAALFTSGGAFTLTADVNFGANFGLLAAYLTSRTANSAVTGVVRLGNTDFIGFRNAANSADLPLGVNTSNQLTFNGSTFLTTAGTLVNNTVAVVNGSGAFASSAVTTATLAFLDATSSVQTQLNSKLAVSTVLGPATGGTGIANNAASTLTIAGSFATVLTLTGATALTLPTIGTLATLAGSEVITNKKYLYTLPAVQTSNYSAAAFDDLIICNGASAGFTVTLPTAVGISGKTYSVKKTDSTFNIITISTTSSQTIDGSTSTTLNTQNEQLLVCSDGANWQIQNRLIPSFWKSYTPTGSWSAGSPVYTGQYKRIGDSISVQVGVTVSSNPNASPLIVNLPTGLVIDTSKLSAFQVGISTIPNAIGILFSGSGTVVSTFGIYESTTSILVAFTVQASAALASVTNSTPFTFGASSLAQINFLVPISGWND